MKKLKTFLVFAVLSLLFLAIFSACGGEKWDISQGGDGSLTAAVETRGGKVTLVVSGEGEMKDFAPEQAPWKDRQADIEAIEIGSGVKSVGNNAFAGISVSYILLPESVGRIGENAADAGVKLFCENDGVTAAGADLYYYSEELPKTEDRYWQQDKSTGDITDGLTASKRYFHYQNGTPTAWEFYKVLFIGNSFTYRNGVSEPSGGVPAIFNGIAEDLGVAVETYMIAGPGWHLKDHANPQDACGKQVDALLHAVHDFDFVILQEHSTDSMDRYADFESGIKAIRETVSATQNHAEVVLYETWGSPASASARSTTVADMEAELKAVYEKAAESCGISYISYVGRAFTEIYGEHGADAEYNLWDTDNRHQGYTGAYLSACVHVVTLFGLDVRDCLYRGEETVPVPSDIVLSALREKAYSVAFGI